MKNIVLEFAENQNKTRPIKKKLQLRTILLANKIKSGISEV